MQEERRSDMKALKQLLIVPILVGLMVSVTGCCVFPWGDRDHDGGGRDHHPESRDGDHHHDGNRR